MKRLAPLLLLLPSLALAADVAPARTRVNNRCTSYQLCSAESDTAAPCRDPSGTNDIVLHVGRFAHYTFYSTPSSATDYVCNIFTSDDGTPGSGKNDQVNTATITDEAPVYTMAVLLRYLWMNCSTISGGTITINTVVCAMD